MSNHVVIVGLDPSRQEVLATILTTRGWLVVKGEYAAGATSPTVYFATEKPAELTDLKVLAVGVEISKDATPEMLADMIGLPSVGTREETAAEVVIPDAATPPAVPETASTVVVDQALAEAEQAATAETMRKQGERKLMNALWLSS